MSTKHPSTSPFSVRAFIAMSRGNMSTSDQDYHTRQEALNAARELSADSTVLAVYAFVEHDDTKELAVSWDLDDDRLSAITEAVTKSIIDRRDRMTRETGLTLKIIHLDTGEEIALPEPHEELEPATFYGIGWQTFDDLHGIPSRRSKKHLADSRSPDKTLCGAAVPDRHSVADLGSDAGHPDLCKRCDAAAKRRDPHYRIDD